MDVENLFESYKLRKARAIKGDFIDRLHSQFTSTFLLLILIVIGFRQLSDSAIYCWNPVFFSGPQNKFVRQYCWTNSTYWYPLLDRDPDLFNNESKRTVTYYQYILLILIVQIIPFYLLASFWRSSTGDSREFIENLIKSVDRDHRFMDVLSQLEDEEDVEVKYITENTEKSIIKNIELLIKKPKPKMIPLKFLTFKYILLKLFYLLNLVFQFIVLTNVFGFKYLFYGYNYFYALFTGRDPVYLHKEFPIFTLCDFTIHKALKRNNDYTVECILVANVVAEKLFLLVWFWFVILTILTITNLLSWCFEILPLSRQRFVKKYLRFASVDIKRRELEGFCNDYLGIDGITMLMIMRNVSGNLVFLEIFKLIWSNYIKETNNKDN